MEVPSMRRLYLALIVLSFGFVTATYADSVPTFTLTQGSILLTPGGPGILGPSKANYNFTGPNGVFVGGLSTIPAVCLTLNAGDFCPAAFSTQPNESSDF